jgi:hypothetical protein
MPPSKFLVAPRPDKFCERLSYEPFRQRKPSLSHEEALLVANVVVETVKGFLSVITAAPANRRAPVTVEFSIMLSLYLEAEFR